MGSYLNGPFIKEKLPMENKSKENKKKFFKQNRKYDKNADVENDFIERKLTESFHCSKKNLYNKN